MSRSSCKTIQCYNDMRKYLFEHKVEHLAFIRDGKLEILYTQKYIDKLHKEIQELYTIAKEQDSDNVNLIDRLKIILDMVGGEDNDSR